MSWEAGESSEQTGARGASWSELGGWRKLGASWSELGGWMELRASWERAGAREMSWSELEQAGVSWEAAES